MKALVLASLGLLTACDPSKVLGPGGDACEGCVDAGGLCNPGNIAAACGALGNSCVACGDRESCVSGVCQPGAASTAGDACAADLDCGPGGLCAPEVPGGGYCTADCSTFSCADGSDCYDFGGGVALCLRACADDAGCRPEHLCWDGACLPRCTQDSDCDTLSCDLGTGECVDPVVGAGCAQDADCGDPPLFCAEAPGGYCTAACGGPGNDRCPPGSVCSSGVGASLCLDGCAQDADCRDGYICWDDGAGTRACLPRCTADADCGSGACDEASGRCVSRSGGAGGVGAACEQDSDCSATPGDAFCSLNYPGGYCSATCTGAPDLCGAGNVCVTFPSGNAYCERGCETTADCRGEYACLDLGDVSACFPRCRSDADCDPQHCDVNSGECYDPATGDTTVETRDLTASGPVTVFADRVGTGVTVDVPADAVSITFVGKATDASVVIAAARVVAPDGSVVYDRGSLASSWPVMPPIGRGVFSVTAPLSPTAPFAAGTWTIYMLASRQTRASVTAILKRAPSAPQGGTLDVNLFFVGLENLDGAAARGDRDFQVLLGKAFSIWGGAGITQGEVRYIDLSGSAVTSYADLRDDDLPALMKLSSDGRAKEGALNVFLVRTISGGSLAGYVILGEAAGIPGIPANGTGASGLALTMADFPAGAAQIGGTLAHEGGHFLGLFHTTEAGGTSFDPLGDTDECPASRYDRNGNGVMEVSECGGHGAENVMFWSASDEINQSYVTYNQAYVLVRNPLVR